MDTNFLKKLIDAAETFEGEQQEAEPKTLEQFSEWLLANLTKPTTRETPTEGGIGQLIGLMYRYAKNYTKKALKNTPIQTIDEFTYLATLMENPLTKTQVIERHAQEKTTGMAIIQRLLRQGWIEQRDNEADRRSHIIQLTALGHQILRGGFAEMGKVARVVEANLDTAEKAELTRILEKLETFHRTVFDNEKTEDLDIIIEKYKL